MRLNDPRITSTLALVAAAVWVGGMLTLGALVAPVVFTMIPAPGAADAMTVVFQRFDTVALVCVAVMVASEAFRSATATSGPRLGLGAALSGDAIGRLDLARMAMGALGAALVLLEALWITPVIVALHRGGAIRGVGSEGLELDRIHGYAETCGKAQATVGLALIALHVFTLKRAKAKKPARDPAPEEDGGRA
jgi:uncharacterized membrane protein